MTALPMDDLQPVLPDPAVAALEAALDRDLDGLDLEAQDDLRPENGLKRPDLDAIAAKASRRPTDKRSARRRGITLPMSRKPGL